MRRRRSSNSQLPVVPQEVIKRHRSDPHTAFNGLKFLTLPLILKYRILSLVEITDLINMWDTSKGLRMMVGAYCASSCCPQFSQFYNPHNHPPDSLRRFADFYKFSGGLFRRTCQHFSLRRKIQFLEFHLRRHMPNSNQSPSNSLNSQRQDHNLNVCSAGSTWCQAMDLYGIFLKEFTDGWPEHDTQQVFNKLVHVCFSENFWFRLSCIISQRPDTDPQSELTVRFFLRMIFLDPYSLPQEKQSPNAVLSSTTPVPQENHHSVSGTNSVTSRFDSQQNTQENGIYPEVINSLFDGTTDHFMWLEKQSEDEPLSPLSPSNTGDYSLSVGVTESAELLHGTSGFMSLSSTPITVHQSSCFCGIPMPYNCWPASKNLMRILHSFPHKHQARILFILYGPANRDGLLWRTMLENTAGDSEQLLDCFGDLGSVLTHMLYCNLWTSDDVIEILDHLITTPDDWLVENVACLLHTSGPEIECLSLTDKASCGKISEVALIIISLCILQVSISSTPFNTTLS
ncbi:unnamed protein product [Heterobilharzia americana]|nr:unnamed protein product [Heterobilharzia americana]